MTATFLIPARDIQPGDTLRVRTDSGDTWVDVRIVRRTTGDLLQVRGPGIVLERHSAELVTVQRHWRVSNAPH